MPSVLPVIKASPDFKLIARDGKRRGTAAFIFQSLKKEQGACFRIGFTASRKVGNAVVRNRAKRRLREMVRAYIAAHAGQLPAYDVVLIAKTAAASHNYAAMQADFLKLMRELP